MDKHLAGPGTGRGEIAKGCESLAGSRAAQETLGKTVQQLVDDHAALAAEQKERLEGLRQRVAGARENTARKRDKKRMSQRTSTRDKFTRARLEGRVFGLDEALGEIDSCLAAFPSDSEEGQR